MSPPESPDTSQKYLCVPVELKEPWLIHTLQVKSKRECVHFPKYVQPWVLIVLKVSLMLTCALAIWFETYSFPYSENIRNWKILSTLYDLTCICQILSAYLMDVDDYSNAMVAYLIVFSTNCAFSLWILIFSIFEGEIAYMYSAASIGSLISEFFMWKHQQDYYTLYAAWPKEVEQELLDELKATFDSDHTIGQPFHQQFSLITKISHKVLWPTIPSDSAYLFAFESALYEQTKDGKTEYFVPWSAYENLNSKISQDLFRVQDYKDRIKELRCDLVRQVSLVVQLIKKIYGPKADTMRTVPASTPAIVPWHPQKVDGMFVARDGKMEGFVNFDDFRALIVYSVSVKNCLDDLFVEKQDLKTYLQLWKGNNNNIVAKLLEIELPIEPETKTVKIDDVD